MKLIYNSIAFTLILFTSLQGFGQKEITLDFSNPSEQKSIDLSIMNGEITIIGSDRKDVRISYELEGLALNVYEDSKPKKAEGMKRIGGSSFNFEAEEKNNTIKIKANNLANPVKLTIEVPREINVDVQKTMGEFIHLENISGDINLEASIGHITAKNISGVVNASCATGNITIDMNELIDPKHMKLTSATGDIDLTIPAQTKASIKMKSAMGDIYSDHDIDIDNESKSVTKKDKNMYVIKSGWTRGNLNGGGEVISLKTATGSIYLRKK